MNRTPPQNLNKTTTNLKEAEDQRGASGFQRSRKILRSPIRMELEAVPTTAASAEMIRSTEDSLGTFQGAVATMRVQQRAVASTALTVQNQPQTTLGVNFSPRLESIYRLRQLEENTVESCRHVLDRMQQAIRKQKNISKEVQDGVLELREALDVIKHYRQLWKSTETQRLEEERAKSKPAAAVSQLQAEDTPLTARSKRPATSPVVPDATKKPREREPDAWKTVTRRKQKPDVERKRSSDDTAVRAPNKGENQQKKTRTRKRRKRKPQPRKRLEAVLVKPVEGNSYANVLRELKKSVKPEEAEVTVKSVRKTKDGSLLLELLDGGRRNQFLDAIKESLKEGAKVRELKPQRTIEIRDLDSLVEAEEIVSAVKEISRKNDADVVVRVSNKNSREQCRAFVTVADDIADVILKAQRLKIGWTYCRVRQANDIRRCFKCFGVGHTRARCGGPDRSGQGLCIRCGTTGHKMRECKNTPKCCICTEQGCKPTDHIPGSSRCTAYKKLIL